MNTNELLESLNNAVTGLIGLYVTDTFEASVRARVDRLLEPLGLRYETRSVTKGAYILFDLRVNLTFQRRIDRTRDRCVESIKFERRVGAEGDTIEDILRNLRLAELNAVLECCDRKVAEAQAEIKEALELKARYLAEYKDLVREDWKAHAKDLEKGAV